MIPLPEDELRLQRRRIREAMRYAVPEGRQDEAEDLLLRYREDRFGLALLHEFYATLPEAREDWVREIRVLARKQGVFLLLLITGQAAYMYLISGEGLEFQGQVQDGFLEKELLDYFGYQDLADFRDRSDPEHLPVYLPLQADQDVCPACHAVTGELHELGCPVEVCPWCGGQLVACSCRFDRLGRERLSGDEDLRRLEVLLDEQGRLPYTPEQRPSFADEGPGIVID